MIFSKKKRFYKNITCQFHKNYRNFQNIISLVNFILWSENLEKINLYTPSR